MTSRQQIAHFLSSILRSLSNAQARSKTEGKQLRNYALLLIGMNTIRLQFKNDSANRKLFHHNRRYNNDEMRQHAGQIIPRNRYNGCHARALSEQQTQGDQPCHEPTKFSAEENVPYHNSCRSHHKRKGFDNRQTGCRWWYIPRWFNWVVWYWMVLYISKSPYGPLMKLSPQHHWLLSVFFRIARVLKSNS